MSNIVYTAMSLDGKIATVDNGVEWLDPFMDDKKVERAFKKIMDSIDCLLMGKNTFEKVLSFGVEWPYSKKVFVASNSLTSVPEGLYDKVEIVKGSPIELQKYLNSNGYMNIYIDGGIMIQSFLDEDLIDELTITVVPIILGGGISLFKDGKNLISLKTLSVDKFDNGLVELRYKKSIINS